MRLRYGSLAALALAAFVLLAPGRAAAHVGVFVGAYPGYAYPYGYPYPYAYPYYPAPYYYTEPTPPPGFVRGHWEWRTDGYGRRYPAWVPAHLD
jgi:hypothetical protein